MSKFFEGVVDRLLQAKEVKADPALRGKLPGTDSEEGTNR
jgi:hypothetical protein